MSDDVRTQAFLVRIGFNALTAGDTVHLPMPLDEHNAALVKMGLLTPVDDLDNVVADGLGDADAGSVFTQDSGGEFTTVLGVMPAPVANARRTRRSILEKRAAEMDAKAEDPDGEGDS